MEFNTSYVNSSLPSNISFVEEIEDELVNALIGNTVLLVFFMICGAFGNCMVLFVYKDYKFSSNKIDDRRFIPYLALVDFMASLTSCCQYVIENQYPLRYPGKFSCKVLNFISTFPASISGLILLAIAFHRYKRVCNPFSRLNITQNQTIAATAILGFLISIPSLFLSDTALYYDTSNEIYVKKCQRLSRGSIIMSKVYSSFIAALCVGGIGFIIVTYTMVGVRIKRQYNHAQNTVRMNPVIDANDGFSDNTASNFSIFSTREVNDNAKEPKSQSTFYIEDVASGHELSSCGPSAYNTLDTTLKKKKKQVKQTKFVQRKRARFLRFTWMFVLMSGVYCLTLLPRVTVRVLEMVTSDFWFILDKESLVALTFLGRIYIISFIVNPLIYGFLDNMFRKKCKALFRNCICSRTRITAV